MPDPSPTVRHPESPRQGFCHWTTNAPTSAGFWFYRIQNQSRDGWVVNVVKLYHHRAGELLRVELMVGSPLLSEFSKVGMQWSNAPIPEPLGA